jgi:thiol:disulfide interchange protein DsbA
MELPRMKILSRALVVLALLSPLACSAADDAPYKLNEHYTRAREVQPPANPAKIEVMEVFAYSCPHCYDFEPVLAKWLKNKPADVEFVRTPATIGLQQNEPRNRAFFAARMLGVLDRFHPALFDAVHKERRTMATRQELRALFAQSTGGKAEDFDGAYAGFAADAGVRRAEMAVRALGITGVPSVVVDGKYVVSPGMAKGLDGMMKVTDHLVAQARRERAKR